jgi:hypothetical protein
MNHAILNTAIESFDPTPLLLLVTIMKALRSLLPLSCMTLALFLSCDQVRIEPTDFEPLDFEHATESVPVEEDFVDPELELSEADVERLIDLVRRRKNNEITKSEALALVRKFRDENPFVSLRERLEYEPQREATLEAPRWSKPEPDQRISKIPKYSARWESLELLHNEEVSLFIQRNCNGRLRSTPPSAVHVLVDDYPSAPFDLISNDIVHAGQGDEVTLPEKSIPSKYEWYMEHRKLSEGASGPTFREASLEKNPNLLLPVNFLADLNDESIQNFTDRWRWGYVESLDRVSGFAGHAIRDRIEADPWVEPEATEEFFKELKSEFHLDRWSFYWKDQWENLSLAERKAVKLRARELRISTPKKAVWLIKSMQLVSLLKHDSPRVYDGHHFPSMDELEQVPTRDLDAFESQSLSKLIDGEEIAISSHMNRIQMLGAIRATNACLVCHEVSEGRLLGAFTYDLVRNIRP